MKFLLSLVSLTVLSGMCSATYAFFCPTNFNLIELGNTQEQVLQKCGKPDEEQTKMVKAEGAQEWSYFVPQTVTTPTLYSTQGTMKTEISFDNNGKVINISVNGIAVGATTVCGGYNLQLGADRDQVKTACGEPTFINKDANPATLPPDAKKETKITTFLYKKAVPPAKLTFEDGILKSQE